ncbi:FtsX-like permease family protein [Actinomadura sp. LD22]|uniref:FtsX-like permease family protein n=1 Tax=Actinomadura physcomitrii TaxID=2650748 RepID=A0A6I4MLV4_9ACTN|nr:FtsX-like permease family protein [Actinomadura physcomitrii]MWA07178.1 FtsX-like permease family protein [Actinomadura physcomitrii]
MMRRALHTGPWLRLARTQWAPLAALAVLTLVTALLAVAVPAATTAGYDRDAATTVGTDADLQVVGKAKGTGASSAIPNVGALTANAFTWQQLLPGSLRTVTGPPEASVALDTPQGISGEFTEPRELDLGWDPDTGRRILITAGHPPVNEVPLNPGRTTPEIQVMVAERYAQAMGYKVGARLTLVDKEIPEPLHVRITGLYAPQNPRDAYWAPRVSLLQVTQRILGRDGTKVAHGTALTDAGGYTMIAADARRGFTFTWRFPVRTGAVDTGRARTIAAELDSYRAAVQGRTGLFACTVETPLEGRLDAFLGRLRTARSVLGMAQAGLLAVAAGVLLLAAGLLGERLRPVLGTMRARGASLRQLTRYAGGLTALGVLPAAAAGYAAGLLLDAGPPQRSSLYAVAALVAVVLALSGAMVLRERGGGLGSAGGAGRDDFTAARPSPRRLVLDLLLIVVAVAGVVVLRQRGGASGDDPLVAAVPVLLGAALGTLVLRAYPYLLRAGAPLLRRGRGAVWFVGLARASRQRMIGALPLVILLLAAAVAGFSATVDTALRHGQVRASYSTVGGDVRIGSTGLDPSAAAKARAVRGVTAVVPARVVQQVTGPGEPAPITVVGIDLDAYRAAFPGVPGIPDAPNGQLVSPGAAGILDAGSKPVTLSSHYIDPFQFKPAATIDRFPSMDTGSAFAVVPYTTFGSGNYPTELFVRGDHVDVAALRKVLDAAAPKGAPRDVQVRADVLHGMTGVPMVDLVHRTFRNAALIGGGYGLLAVLLVLVVGARARGRTVAHLRVLGLKRGQSRALALVEIAPVLLCAVAAGWVLGLLLPEITGPVVDLRPYTSGFTATGHTPGAAALLGLLAALLLAAAAALAVDRAFDRPKPGDVLRTGD